MEIRNISFNSYLEVNLDKQNNFTQFTIFTLPYTVHYCHCCNSLYIIINITHP